MAQEKVCNHFATAVTSLSAGTQQLIPDFLARGASDGANRNVSEPHGVSKMRLRIAADPSRQTPCNSQDLRMAVWFILNGTWKSKMEIPGDKLVHHRTLVEERSVT